MKTLFTLILLATAARAEVRLCEELKSGAVVAVICPQTLNTLLYLAQLPGDQPGVMNLSIKTQNQNTVGYRVSVTYYRSLDKTDVANVTGFLDAGKLGEYATLALVTGQIGGVKSILITEVPPTVAIVFGE